MITLQFSAVKLWDIITVLKAEIDKNPDGYIDIDFKSVDENSFVPAFSWTPELNTEIPQFLRSGLKALKKEDSIKK